MTEPEQRHVNDLVVSDDDLRAAFRLAQIESDRRVIDCKHSKLLDLLRRVLGLARKRSGHF